jgi:hypothetical protein
MLLSLCPLLKKNTFYCFYHFQLAEFNTFLSPGPVPLMATSQNHALDPQAHLSYSYLPNKNSLNIIAPCNEVATYQDI